MGWLLKSEFDSITTIALWSTAAVVVTTVVLFIYTVGLRVATISGERRRRSFLRRWREIFAASMLGLRLTPEQKLPRVSRGDRINLLEEWNRVRSMVDGPSVDRLIKLAHTVGIPDLALHLLHHGRMRSRILAVQTIGHLRQTELCDEILALTQHENIALSVTAAAALVDIDPDLGISLVVPMISTRRDWPKTRVSVLLQQAGSARISEPMYRAIANEDEAGKTYLLQFARLMEAEMLDALASDLLRRSDDPGILNAALKLVSGFAGVPRIASLAKHDVWFVRMQAAKVLGRVGQEEHLSLLVALLSDSEWWVRYRAAQAITKLPFVGPNELRRLRRQQTDRFARDILQQTFSEVGLV